MNGFGRIARCPGRSRVIGAPPPLTIFNAGSRGIVSLLNGCDSANPESALKAHFANDEPQ
jgi:hypothetical protein